MKWDFSFLPPYLGDPSGPHPAMGWLQQWAQVRTRNEMPPGPLTLQEWRETPALGTPPSWGAAGAWECPPSLVVVINALALEWEYDLRIEGRRVTGVIMTGAGHRWSNGDMTVDRDPPDADEPAPVSRFVWANTSAMTSITAKWLSQQGDTEEATEFLVLLPRIAYLEWWERDSMWVSTAGGAAMRAVSYRHEGPSIGGEWIYRRSGWTDPWGADKCGVTIAGQQFGWSRDWEADTLVTMEGFIKPVRWRDDWG